ncbi:glycosyltransferase family 39 protein [Actinomycetospora corticicola]|uniref:4-amino-4-deoxy-L-arabinose transferase-like glycosyltransferase n=1 Tax=Actinomycetospora corticicola TaxID=663602 RepID=A0A7Y9DZH5_9PSEU|nr:glycosyltransferase family 39 protein [Actinomycetospora corticicola]NYD38352.1 4-amino-4-deoxy-L-arabinose transferase-like glycosyltransferase [Actinomycetospora corticicola]
MTTTPARGTALPPLTVRPAVAPFARRPVLLIAAAVALLLGAVSSRYGWFGDEYYFVSAGARPSLGYADQPPLLPLLAALLDRLAPGNLVVLRLPATLLTAAGTVVAALIAREFGGGRRAQVLAAAVTAISPYLLATGHLLATSTLDPVCWAVVLWLLARWMRQQRDGAADDRLLAWLGLAVAVALFGKVLIVVLLGAVLVGVVVSGPRRLLGRPWSWVGLGLAALTTIPTLVWQATHGWPQLRMGSVVAGESDLFGDRWQFLPRALYYAGVLPGAVLVVVGVWALLRYPPLRAWRALGWASVLVTAVLLAAGGRPYYLSGLYALLIAAGSVAACSLPASRRRAWWRWVVHPAVVVVAAVVTVLWVLPFGPASWRATSEFETMGQVGWSDFAAGVARQWRALPPGTVVVAYSYWYASALEHEGPRYGLPTPVYSTHRGFGYFDVPPGSADALLVGDVKWAPRFCSRLVPLPTYVGPQVTPVNDRVLLAVCTPSRPWSEAWPSLRNLA